MIGRTLAHYQILELLGKGGMGEVYRARDTKLGRDVALKVLPKEIAGNPDLVARFHREARAVAALRHPNIVTLYSAEEAEGVQFLTMEILHGETLTEVIGDEGLPLERVFEIAVPLVDAARAAHEKGITHRDLKPENIILDEEGNPNILDFGLAHMIVEAAEGDRTVLAGGRTTSGAILGTVGYMSPEQIEGRTVDARSDIFALRRDPLSAHHGTPSVHGRVAGSRDLLGAP